MNQNTHSENRVVESDGVKPIEGTPAIETDIVEGANKYANSRAYSENPSIDAQRRFCAVDWQKGFDAGRRQSNAQSELKKQNGEFREASTWISVEDRLPKLDEYVLCYRLLGSMSGYSPTTPSIGKLRIGDRFTCETDWVIVTHWVPLPSSPIASEALNKHDNRY